MEQKAKILKTEILANNWATLKKITYEYVKRDGTVEVHTREAYDRGNGAAILLYHRENRSVILTRQFRLPSFINGNPGGLLIEACAGVLDRDNPEDCIKREVEEETGYTISQVTRVFEAYMSPGSVTEILYFFIGEYSHSMKTAGGGGLDHEEEDIEVVEMSLDEALHLVHTGGIRDAKTIMLLQYAKLQGIV